MYRLFWLTDSKSIINALKKATEISCEWVYQTVALVKYVMDAYIWLTFNYKLHMPIIVNGNSTSKIIIVKSYYNIKRNAHNCKEH